MPALGVPRTLSLFLGFPKAFQTMQTITKMPYIRPLPMNCAIEVAYLSGAQGQTAHNLGSPWAARMLSTTPTFQYRSRFTGGTPVATTTVGSLTTQQPNWAAQQGECS